MPILGAYDGVKAGHAINNQILHALFADTDAYEVVTLENPAKKAVAQQSEQAQYAHV